MMFAEPRISEQSLHAVRSRIRESVRHRQVDAQRTGRDAVLSSYRSSCRIRLSGNTDLQALQTGDHTRQVTTGKKRSLSPNRIADLKSLSAIWLFSTCGRTGQAFSHGEEKHALEACFDCSRREIKECRFCESFRSTQRHQFCKPEDDSTNVGERSRARDFNRRLWTFRESGLH